MNTQKKTIDRRPFQSKAELERQQNLAGQYRNVAIPELVAALRPAVKLEEQIDAA